MVKSKGSRSINGKPVHKFLIEDDLHLRWQLIQDGFHDWNIVDGTHQPDDQELKEGYQNHRKDDQSAMKFEDVKWISQVTVHLSPDNSRGKLLPGPVPAEQHPVQAGWRFSLEWVPDLL